MRLAKLSGIYIAITTALIVSSPPAAADDTLKREEIIVIGEKIERNLLDTNTSVSVQTAEQLERSNDLSIQEVFKRMASVVATGVGVQSFDFSIRGIGTDGVGGAGQEGLASIIVDGTTTTRVQNARGITSLFDIERVEVLRGPQSTNRGKNSLAGAVIVKTKDPQFEHETYVKAEYASYNTYQAALAHTGPINDEFAYRVTIDHQYTDGFIDNLARGEDDYLEDRTTSGRIKLLYAPAALPLRAMVSHTILDAKTNNDIESYDTANKRFISLNPYDSVMKSDHSITTLHLDYDISDNLSIKSITTYNEFDSRDRNNAYALTVPTEEQAWKAGIDQEEINQELRADYVSEKFTGVLGIYYSDYEELNTRDGVGIADFLTPFGPADLDIDFYNPMDIETKAVFGEVDYRMTDRITLTAGFRYEELDFDLLTSGVITLQPFGIPFRDLTLEGDRDQNEFLPKLAVNYALTEGQKVGFTFAEGYRPGGVDLDIFAGAGATPYESEHTKNYELSYKSLFLDDQLSINANLFYIDWKDMQTSGSAQIRSGTYNAGKATVYGGEFELTWTDNDSFDFYFNAGYSNTEFDEFVTGGGANDFSGNEFAYAPKWTVAGGGYYTYRGLTLGAEASYRDSYYDNITNNFRVDSLTTVNLSASYNYRNASVRIYANNVFDEVIASRDIYQLQGQQLGLLTDPIVVGGRITFSF